MVTRNYNPSKTAWETSSENCTFVTLKPSWKDKAKGHYGRKLHPGMDTIGRLWLNSTLKVLQKIWVMFTYRYSPGLHKACCL